MHNSKNSAKLEKITAQYRRVEQNSCTCTANFNFSVFTALESRNVAQNRTSTITSPGWIHSDDVTSQFFLYLAVSVVTMGTVTFGECCVWHEWQAELAAAMYRVSFTTWNSCSKHNSCLMQHFQS